MKVLKFGGTSVGTVESLRNVKSIVESCNERVIVVVSALGGFTDQLIATARKAEAGSEEYISDLQAMKQRHFNIIDELVEDCDKESVKDQISNLFESLSRTYKGVYLLEELSRRSLDKVVSFGERMSSCIISKIISGAMLFDSPRFIKTLRRFGKHVLDNDSTQKLIHAEFDNVDFKVAVVPGFIATDASGVFTNLGRGGSDYTAAILAAALDAQVLEIWTDVDGFMTADPRLIKEARVIDSLSFIEAMELCNFGAKVIYPPTIYPVFHKNIPIYIKNTFNPHAPGTCIKDNRSVPSQQVKVKGVSSVTDSCMITLKSASDLKRADFNTRVLNTMARNGVSVLLVSDTSSKNATSVAVTASEIEQALEALEKEFAGELETGELLPMDVQRNLATIAIVADNMRNDVMVPGKLRETLALGKLTVVGRSQGTPETSIAFVVPGSERVYALQLVHNVFFGS